MQQNTQVAISKDFFRAYDNLPRQIRGKVNTFIDKFLENPISPGINYEKIFDCRDRRINSVRIDDTYRGIVIRQPETGVYVLLWVDHHDKAYAWAKNKKSGIDAATGAMHVIDLTPDDLNSSEQADETVTAPGLFYWISDDDLMNVGVPKELIPLVRSIATKEELEAKHGRFPERAYESLVWLSEGIGLNEVIEDVRSGGPFNEENFAEALSRPETLESFVVIDDNEALRRILDEPLALWRVFLHPAQRKVVERDYKGSASVIGGAGTGKTVVAMHRAKRLASQLTGDEKILFTTFTKNLPADISDNLGKICSTDELARIEVTNVDDWAADFMKQHGVTDRIVFDTKERMNLWKDAIARSGTDAGLLPSFYEDEYNRVAMTCDALTYDEYASAPRRGRGNRLNLKQRANVWSVFEAYLQLLDELQVVDGQTLLYRCRELINNANIMLPYRHVITDETQDLGPAALRLLRTIAGPEHENDLFFVGDSHQRIYKNKSTLARAGINVRGRSSVLRINYRTTEETRRFAFSVLKGAEFDDLNTGADDSRCRSLTHGPAPLVAAFETADEEFSALCAEIDSLVESGVEPRNICIVARTHKLLERYMQRLKERGTPFYEIRATKTDDEDREGVRIATMHRVKGLEFQYVFVVSANKGQIPLPAALDRSNTIMYEESMTAEKCLLYVALTRAQKKAYVMGYGQISDFVVEN